MNKVPTILVVDDVPANVDLLEAYLSPEGFRVLTASSGEEALEKLSRVSVDLVLLDVMMSGMDGFEVTRRVRADPDRQLLPIILVTALQGRDERVRGIEAGCDDFISKPLDRVELLARVRSLLKVKALHDLQSTYQKQLEGEVVSRTQELEQALGYVKAASLETIYRLSMASEFKDEETGLHLRCMSRYAAAIARKMGLAENLVEGILYAAPMHDLGKIGIPDRILVKPGELASLEWDILKLHTLIGARILEGSTAEYIRLAETIARCHHEMWDGTGYPNNLRGAEIPLVARIATVADVFDGLSSKRPYKPALSIERSVEMVVEGSGTRFDPDVVAAFLAVLDEIIAIKADCKKDYQPALEIPELMPLLRQYTRNGSSTGHQVPGAAADAFPRLR